MWRCNMKNDKKILELVRTLRAKAEGFVDEVEALGNQCAYTDRIVEEIIQVGEQLKEAYSQQFLGYRGGKKHGE
ncbi:MAG: hypothetical protein J6V44_16455 [Methanobrevibacter sp.]|nr:hypothetical protein [Methanobrevibacter sp.]